MTEYADRCEAFGRRLRYWRLERGIPQEKLAEMAGVDRTYVSDAEAGKRNPTLKTIAKLATAPSARP